MGHSEKKITYLHQNRTVALRYIYLPIQKRQVKSRDVEVFFVHNVSIVFCIIILYDLSIPETKTKSLCYAKNRNK